MSDYRLYSLDGAGIISFADSIRAADDEDAVRQARELKSNALKCEVWHGTRLVAALDTNDLAGGTDSGSLAVFASRCGDEASRQSGRETP